MTIAKAFPDFDVSTLPAIPAGFEDASWKNDACPSFLNTSLGLKLWIDYADPAERENDGPRFMLTAFDDDDTTDSVQTDDFAVIVAAIEEERALTADCLELLSQADGAMLNWQVAIHARHFAALHKRGVIPMDGDLYFHPKATKVCTTAYTMKAQS